MHKGIMGARRLEAIRSVMSNLQDLAFEPELKEKAAGLEAINARDPQLRELYILEAVAEILEDMETVEVTVVDLVETIKAEGPELTKTSMAALEEWAEASSTAPETPPETSEAEE